MRDRKIKLTREHSVIPCIFLVHTLPKLMSVVRSQESGRLLGVGTVPGDLCVQVVPVALFDTGAGYVGGVHFVGIHGTGHMIFPLFDIMF